MAVGISLGILGGRGGLAQTSPLTSVHTLNDRRIHQKPLKARRGRLLRHLSCLLRYTGQLGGFTSSVQLSSYRRNERGSSLGNVGASQDT